VLSGFSTRARSTGSNWGIGCLSHHEDTNFTKKE
jgi:hypothetical protein